MAWWDDEPCTDNGAGDDPFYVHVVERHLPPTLEFDPDADDE